MTTILIDNDKNLDRKITSYPVLMRGQLWLGEETKGSVTLWGTQADEMAIRENIKA